MNVLLFTLTYYIYSHFFITYYKYTNFLFTYFIHYYYLQEFNWYLFLCFFFTNFARYFDCLAHKPLEEVKISSKSDNFVFNY